MLFDHLGIGVDDFEKSKAFYKQALAPLGFEILSEGENWARVGKAGQGHLWFGTYRPKPAPIHIAFIAETREQVNAFYTAALGSGGKDNGAPGVREQYHPNYYAAFVIDPDGHNIEAVCQRPEASSK